MSAKPELLAPAGAPENLRQALAYGADAVYAGIPRWSLRVRGNGFARSDFADGILRAHALGRKFYAVLNVIPHMRRLKGFADALKEVAALKPDALIMADPGLIMEARELCPETPVHLSVQANTVNALSVKFWQRCGISRCILARELPLSEIAMIREACPDTELEVFVHGALCIAVSGRCLISGLLARRVEKSCRELGVKYRRMPSGAGHDAMYMATLIPSALIFVPCKDGVSHSPAETIDWERVRPGYDVLLNTVRGIVM